MQIESFAKIKDVPVFRAGTHNGLTFSDTEIDAMISDTNEALPFLMESMQAGAYRENPHLQGVKGIPAFLNLGHQFQSLSGLTLGFKQVRHRGSGGKR